MTVSLKLKFIGVLTAERTGFYLYQKHIDLSDIPPIPIHINRVPCEMYNNLLLVPISSQYLAYKITERSYK